MNYTAAHIRILETPRGEAPLWVRRQWVGLELPLKRRGIAGGLSVGLFADPPADLWAALGFALRGRMKFVSRRAVEVEAALRVLEAKSPDAAMWWRTNVPHLCKPGRWFLFRARECCLVWKAAKGSD